MSTQEVLNRCIRQSKMYGCIVLAHRNRLPVLCCDLNSVVKLVVEAGSFDGEDVKLGSCYVHPRQSEAPQISA
eukprot:2319261-Rhodomonas_salina.1